jgi:hypothetical protein
MRNILIGFAALAFLSATVYAQDDDDDASSPGPKRCPRLQASTVFVPDKSGSRQKGSAERLSETHRTAQDQGWDFEDLEVYIEDGDLQGFFVTYTRPHPCNQKDQ